MFNLSFTQRLSVKGLNYRDKNLYKTILGTATEHVMIFAVV